MDSVKEKAYRAVRKYSDKGYPHLNFSEEYVMKKGYTMGYLRARREYSLTFEDIRWLLGEIKAMPGLWVDTNPECQKLVDKFRKRKKKEND